MTTIKNATNDRMVDAGNEDKKSTALAWNGKCFYAYITDEAEVPATPKTACYLSLYLNEQDHSEAQVAFNCIDVESAMRIINQLADNPMDSLIARATKGQS